MIASVSLSFERFSGLKMRWLRKEIVHILKRATSKRRRLTVLISTLLAAFCGAAAGYVLSGLVMQQRVEMIADQFVQRIQRAQALTTEDGRSILAALRNSPYPPCSGAEIAWMRHLVFQSNFVSEAGRMRDGRIVCSATLGRVNASNGPYTPDLIWPKNSRVYLNLAPYRLPRWNTVAIQEGNAFIVIRPSLQEFFSEAPLLFAVTGLEPGRRSPLYIQGNLVGVLPSILTKTGRERVGGNLYATRCDPNRLICVTASMSTASAMRYAQPIVACSTAAGALIASLLSLAFSLLYLRGHDLERQLKEAIREERLNVVYMPIVELASRRLVGAEALVRWNDDEGHAISPETFVGIAEDRGFIGKITEMVVRRVLLEFGNLLRAHPGFSISVNVTAADFADPAFLPMLDHALQQAGVAPQSLSIEITESSTARRDVIRSTIAELRRRGHRVHIDDFGTGYSSLAYLHELRIDAIKIDKSFTMAIGTEAVMETVLPQIIAMANALRLDVIVEGIETEEQAAYFMNLRVPRYGQGWLFGTPGPAEDLAAAIALLDAEAGEAEIFGTSPAACSEDD